MQRRPRITSRGSTRFLEKLHLLDGGEAEGVVDVPRVRADGDPAAHVLVVVQEGHPHPVEAPPGRLVPRRPVEVVRAVVGAIGLIEVPERRQRVLLVPVGVAATHVDVAAGQVGGHGRVEDHVQRLELGQEGLPLRASLPVNEVPLPCDLPIAATAAAHVQPGMVVGLSGGTTCTELARWLRGKPVTVVTNAINVATELYNHSLTKVIVTGGVLNSLFL